jgi:hypothetical protein
MKLNFVSLYDTTGVCWTYTLYMGKLYTPETLPYGEQTVSPSRSDLNTLTLYDNYYYIDNPTMTVYS